MATNYIVEYIQVNINVGDCEIILLLEEKNGKKSIKYSVMVDGGMGHFMPMENIRRRVFPDIERKYVSQGTFQLDAIVITHWDEDHYGGILNFLKDPWYTVSGGQKKKFLKKNGQTRLYVPYEPPKKLAKFNDDFEVSRQDGELKTKPGGATICKYLDDMPEMEQALLTGAPVSLGNADISELIGRNLFTDVRPNPFDAQGMTSPKELVDAHGATMPGLYCVAANNRFLGNGQGAATNDTTSSNRSSIVCMVIHPNGIVSHYLAGDAHKELEDKIIGWTSFTTLIYPIDKVGDDDRIAIVKASHHGSYTATPIEMCQTYKPKYFVFSAGNQVWEVLLYVCSYCQSLGEDISPSGVWMTSFPYWMRQGVEHFLPTEEPQPRVERYRETIKEFFKDLEPEHIRKLYKLVKKAKDKADAITAAKILGEPAEEDSAKTEKDKIEQKIRTIFELMLNECSPIRKDNYVLPDKRGGLTSHVSYISFLLDGTPDVSRIYPGFKRLKPTVTSTKRPSSPGDGAPQAKGRRR